MAEENKNEETIPSLKAQCVTLRKELQKKFMADIKYRTDHPSVYITGGHGSDRALDCTVRVATYADKTFKPIKRKIHSNTEMIVPSGCTIVISMPMGANSRTPDDSRFEPTKTIAGIPNEVLNEHMLANPITYRARIEKKFGKVRIYKAGEICPNLSLELENVWDNKGFLRMRIHAAEAPSSQFGYGARRNERSVNLSLWCGLSGIMSYKIIHYNNIGIQGVLWKWNGIVDANLLWNPDTHMNEVLKTVKLEQKTVDLLKKSEELRARASAPHKSAKNELQAEESSMRAYNEYTNYVAERGNITQWDYILSKMNICGTKEYAALLMHTILKHTDLLIMMLSNDVQTQSELDSNFYHVLIFIRGICTFYAYSIFPAAWDICGAIFNACVDNNDIYLKICATTTFTHIFNIWNEDIAPHYLPQTRQPNLEYICSVAPGVIYYTVCRSVEALLRDKVWRQSEGYYAAPNANELLNYSANEVTRIKMGPQMHKKQIENGNGNKQTHIKRGHLVRSALIENDRRRYMQQNNNANTFTRRRKMGDPRTLRENEWNIIRNIYNKGRLPKRSPKKSPKSPKKSPKSPKKSPKSPKKSPKSPKSPKK